MFATAVAVCNKTLPLLLDIAVVKLLVGVSVLAILTLVVLFETIFPREVENENSVIHRVNLLDRSIDDVFACNSYNSFHTDQCLFLKHIKHLFSHLRMSFLAFISVTFLQDAEKCLSVQYTLFGTVDCVLVDNVPSFESAHIMCVCIDRFQMSINQIVQSSCGLELN